MSSESRRIRQEAQLKPKFVDEKPNDASGKNGDSVYLRSGNGVEEFVKDEGRWLSLKTGRPAGEKAYIGRTTTRRLGGGQATAAATVLGNASNHNLLTNLNDDDHSQYVHISSNRAISAAHSFTGTTSFSNIDVNGGTITGITDLAIADGGTGASNSNDWLNTRVTTNANGTLNYDATSEVAPNHDSLAGFVGNEHIDHTNVSITAGNGLTGGGTIASTRTLNVVGGDGITVSADEIEATIDNSTIGLNNTNGAGALYVKNDSIGDTQLAYNTGQHLTTTSDVTFDDLTTTGDIIVGGDDISSNPFSSGFTGSGWRINNVAHLEVSDATIRGTLSVYELLIQQIRATNGAIFVSSAAKVESSSGLSASDDDGTITFEDPSDNNLCPFAANDLIMMQRVNPGALVAKNAAGGATNVIKKLVYKVASVSGKTVTVENGGYNNTSSPSEGDDFVRIGNTSDSARQGIIYLTSDDSEAPYIDIKSDIDSYSDWHSSQPKVRLGKLDGITDTDAGLSGTQSELYGLYSDSVYLKGHIQATSGKIGGISMAASKLYTGDGDFNDGDTGIYLDSNSNFSLGNKLAWNNSTLAIDGSVTIGGSTASVVVSGAASGATANQDSTSTILSGNLTGSVNGTGVSTVTSGAAAGATANQDSTSTIQAGTTADNVGLGNVNNSNFASDGDIEGGEVGGWTINSDAIFTGTKTTTGYTSNGHITLTSNGEIHTPTFYVEHNGASAFKGTVTIGSTNLTSSNTLNQNTSKSDVGLSNVEDKSSSTIRGELTKANVTATGLAKGDINLGNVDNTSDASVLSTAASAANTASKTDGYVGGWEISSTAILGVANGSARIVMTAAGDIVTDQWAIKRDGSASFANNSITFETNGDITSNDYLIERSRLFGAGQDSWNGSSYTDTWISTSTRSSAYGEYSYAINVPPETSSEVSNGYGSRIMNRSSTKWYMQSDAYFKNFTVKTGVILHTQGYRIFCSGTLTIESGATIQNNGSSISGLGTHNGASGAPAGTLKGGADGHHSGAGGAGAGSGADGGHGGAGGGGGGMILISARYISNSGTLRATGGNGGGGESIGN
jgi:hypothetical protein